MELLDFMNRTKLSRDKEREREREREWGGGRGRCRVCVSGEKKQH